MSRKQTVSRRGVSLLEATIFLMIAGGIIGMLWVSYQQVKEGARAEAFYSQILRTVQGVRGYFATRPLPSTAGDVTTYTTAELAAAGVFPGDMCRQDCIDAAGAALGAATIIHVYTGGYVNFDLPVIPGGPSTPEPNRFRLSFTDDNPPRNIPARGCVLTVTRLSQNATALGLTSVVVNGATAVTTFPISTDTASTLCSSKIDNTLELKFTIRMKGPG